MHPLSRFQFVLSLAHFALSHARLLGAILFILFPYALSMGGRADEIHIKDLWTADSGTFFESAAAVADTDGDGVPEAIVAGREELIVLDGAGQERWRWRAPGRLMTYPAVLERPGGTSLLFAADYTGMMTCLDGAGNVAWQRKLEGPSSWSASVVCDLEGDGRPEVIQTDEKGTVWAFNALTGDVVWKASVEGVPVSPAVGDLDGDGMQEVVVATGAGVLHVLGADGGLEWKALLEGRSPSWSTSAPILFPSGEGTLHVLAASSRGGVSCFDADGNRLWRFPAEGPIASGLSAGDIDGDGRVDLFVANQMGVVYRLSESGELVWSIDTQRRSLAAGALVDVTGDGRAEYMLCSQDGYLFVLDDNGTILYERYFLTRTINATPAFGDLRPDLPGLEFAITGGESGLVFCLSAPASTNEANHWPCYRASPRNSATGGDVKPSGGVEMRPLNLAWDRLYTGDPIRWSIQGPAGSSHRLRAFAECARPGGARESAMTTILGESGELRLPIDPITPGARRFQWRVEDEKGNRLFSASREVLIHPFENDRALARASIDHLRGAADRVQTNASLSARALRAEANRLEASLKDLIARQDSAPGSTPTERRGIVDESAGLVKRARRAASLARLLTEAENGDLTKGFLVFEGQTWENRAVEDQLPSRVSAPPAIRRRVVPGEHDPLSLGLLNLTDRELQVRTLAESPANGPTVVLRRSIPVPSSVGEPSWDPLPKLDSSGVISVPPLSVRELWLDCQLAETPPGAHTVRVRLWALNGPGVTDDAPTPETIPPPEGVVEIQYDVLPFQMAPSGAFRLCTWGAPEGPRVPDLLAHGNNVFCAPLGTPVYDSAGRLSAVDYSRLDEIIGRLAGQDTVLLLMGYPALREEKESPAYREALAFFVKNLVDHLAGKGLDYSRFALYPADEPGGHGWNAVDPLVAFGKLVKEIDPRVLIYINGGGEVPMYEAMREIAGVWCPDIFMAAEDSTVMRLIRESGKALWTYNCSYRYSRPVGPNIKNTNLLAEFRTAALYALRHGLTGIGYWCYDSGSDPWNRIDDEYVLVYPGREGPIPSRRWEAVREGIEDYRILIALKDRLQDSNNASLPAALRERITRLIESGLPDLLDRGLEEMRLGLARYVLDESFNEKKMSAFREEMMDCVAALSTP